MTDFGPFHSASSNIHISVQKTLKINKRKLNVVGIINRIETSKIKIGKNKEDQWVLAGEQIIDLLSLTTDAEKRDKNVIKHLFKADENSRFIRIRILYEQQNSEEKEDFVIWTGEVEFDDKTPQSNPVMNGLKLKVSLRLSRATKNKYILWNIRTHTPIKMSISDLKLPFSNFLQATGNPLVPDSIEMEWGMSLIESPQKDFKNNRVCIAGAGIAGMAAAHALNEQGVDVILLEKESITGGKTSSHIDITTGELIEHGIHGIFPNYLNFKKLITNAGLTDDIYSDTKFTGMTGPKGMASTEVNTIKGLSPLFLLKLIPKGIFRLRDLVSTLAFMIRSMLAPHLKTEYDNATFKSVMDRSGVSKRVRDHMLEPYVKNLSYARSTEVSARIAFEALNYYVLEYPDDIKARWLKKGPTELIFHPWHKELALRGVKFKMRSEIKKVVTDPKHNFLGFAVAKVFKQSELGSENKLWIEDFGGKKIAFSWETKEKKLSAYSAKCTHQGCTVNVAEVNKKEGFLCPCHGGFFSKKGKAVIAPPTEDLAEIPLTSKPVGDDVLWLLDDTSNDSNQPSVINGNYGIIAVDITSIKKLISSKEEQIKSLSNIGVLRTTSVMVLRMWFKGKIDLNSDSGVLAANDILDNYFVLKRLQKEFERDDYTVIECHIGDSEKIHNFSDFESFQLACDCLSSYFPELSIENLDITKSKALRHKDTFSLFSPGDFEKTPYTVSKDRPNLFLAGDWVSTSTRSWFMERAATTGLESANAILEQIGLEKVDILEKKAQPKLYRIVAKPFLAWISFKKRLRHLFKLE